MSYRRGKHVYAGTRRGFISAADSEDLAAAIRQGLAANLSDRATAMRAGCSPKTVSRYRDRHNIAPYPRAA